MPSPAPWTKQCLRQADKIIIIITEAGSGSELSAIENAIFHGGDQQHAQGRELVVLYPEETERPTISHQFLALRKVKRHYNIRMNDKRYICRLARMITYRGIGLVL